MMFKHILFLISLMSFVCMAEDDILQNHQNRKPYEIVEEMESVLEQPANFRTKEDLVKRQRYLDVYRKNLEILFPIKSNPTKWFTYYREQFLILLVEKKYTESVKLSLWFADTLEKTSDILTDDFLLIVYLDLSLCGALQKDIHFMEKYMQTAKKLFDTTTEGLSLFDKYPYRSMAFVLQYSIFSRAITNYEKLDDWDRAYTIFSEFEKIYGNDFCQKIDRKGDRYLFLYGYYQKKGNLSKAEYYALENVKTTQKDKIVYTSVYLFLAERCVERKEYKRSLVYCNCILNDPDFGHRNSIYHREKKKIEVYLIAAECYAALGEKEKCLEYLKHAESLNKDPVIRKRIQNIRDKAK